MKANPKTRVSQAGSSFPDYLILCCCIVVATIAALQELNRPVAPVLTQVAYVLEFGDIYQGSAAAQGGGSATTADTSASTTCEPGNTCVVPPSGLPQD